MQVTDLPFLNACLNASASVSLIVGYYLIRNKRILAHRFTMFIALGLSTLFLTSYVVYHSKVGSVAFTGEGWIRTVYFMILISHTILAMALPVLVGITLVRALRERFDRHKVIARWTLPIWLYVSVTGVAVYVLLYEVTLGA